MTIKQFEMHVAETASKESKPDFGNLNGYNYTGIEEGCLGLSSESGEVLDILKKFLFQGHDLDRTEMALELGDVLWYLTLCAMSLDMTLDEIMELNVEKLHKRYPNGFSKDRSVNREKS